MNEGHGHVYPRDDLRLARCGGPGICRQCTNEAYRKSVQDKLKLEDEEREHQVRAEKDS